MFIPSVFNDYCKEKLSRKMRKLNKATVSGEKYTVIDILESKFMQNIGLIVICKDGCYHRYITESAFKHYFDPVKTYPTNNSKIRTVEYKVLEAFYLTLKETNLVEDAYILTGAQFKEIIDQPDSKKKEKCESI